MQFSFCMLIIKGGIFGVPWTQKRRHSHTSQKEVFKYTLFFTLTTSPSLFSFQKTNSHESFIEFDTRKFWVSLEQHHVHKKSHWYIVPQRWRVTGYNTMDE